MERVYTKILIVHPAALLNNYYNIILKRVPKISPLHIRRPSCVIGTLQERMLCNEHIRYNNNDVKLKTRTLCILYLYAADYRNFKMLEYVHK